MENNEFGMEAIISNGLGFSDSLFNTKKTNFDGDFDSMSLEIASTENLVNFAETYNQLDAYNADQKIRMLKKLHVHTNNVPGSYGKSVEKFIVEQSLEEAATKEAAGETSGANPAKLPNGAIGKQRNGFLSKLWDTLVGLFRKIKTWIIEKINWIKSKFVKKSSSLINDASSLNNSIWDDVDKYMPQSANKSDDGAVHIKKNTVEFFANSVRGLEKVGTILEAQAKDVCDKGNQIGKEGNADGLVRSINGAYEVLKKFAPDFDLPKIQGSSKNSVAEFNKLYKNCVANLKYEHDPSLYCKLFTGEECTPLGKLSKKQQIKAIYGTDNPRDILVILREAEGPLSDIESTLNDLDKRINTADSKFKGYLQHKDRNIMNKDGSFNARTENGNENDDVVYQWATTTTITFKLAIAITSIAMKIVTNMNTNLKTEIGIIDSAIAARTSGNIFTRKKNAQNVLKENGYDDHSHDYDYLPQRLKAGNKADAAKAKADDKAKAKAAKDEFKKNYPSAMDKLADKFKKNK